MVLRGFVWLLVVLFAATVPAASSALGETGTSSRPNIVFILTDDMRQDEMMRVEGLASLARSGTTFENSFVTNSLCCPSRATALTGQYSHNHKVLTNAPPVGGWDKFEAAGNARSNLATWLHSAGYRTGFFGKFLNGYDRMGPPRGWDYWVHVADAKERGTAADINGTLKYYPQGTFQDDIAGREAAEFVRKAKGERSTFVALWFQSPHSPFHPPRRYAHRHDGDSFEKPPSFGEADVSDKPLWVQRRSLLGERYWGKVVKARRSRLEELEDVALNINRVSSALASEGKLANTYFVFTSDNGLMFGEHRVRAKQAAYEESIRVPLTVSGPGVAQGATRKELVANHDLAPTILALAGLPQRDSFDGRSLQPLMEAGANPQWRSAFLVEHWKVSRSHAKNSGIPNYKAMRTEDKVYVEYSTDEKELYDLSEDPDQLTNVAGQRPSEEAGLAERLEDLKSCSGETCRTLEDESIP